MSLKTGPVILNATLGALFWAVSLCHGQSLFMGYEPISSDPGQLIQKLPYANLYPNVYNPLTVSKPPSVDTVINAAIDQELIKRGLIQPATAESNRVPQRSLFVQLERPYARALAFGALLNSVKKTNQTADDLAVQTFLAQLVQVRLIVQTGVAYNEYLKWAANCTVYTAPPGYPGYNRESNCQPPAGLASLFWLGPYAPNVKKYGRIAAWGSPVPDAPIAIAEVGQLLSAIGAGGLGQASLISDSNFATDLDKAIRPFAYSKNGFKVSTVADTTYRVASIGANAGARAISLVSGPLAIVFFAAQTLIEESIAVADAAEEKGKLQNAFTAAQGPLPDMKKFVASSNGLRRVLGSFVETTIWTDASGNNPDGYALPAPTGLNKPLTIAPWGALISDAKQIYTPFLEDWNGNGYGMYLQNGWFVIADGVNPTHYVGAIQYKTWDGSNWTVQTASGGFYHTPQGSTTGQFSPVIRYIDSLGALQTLWNSQTAPAQFDNSVFFQIQNGANTTIASEFKYRTWDNSVWATHYADGQLVHINQATGQQLTGGFFNYLTWDGSSWGAALDFEGVGFLHRQAGAALAHGDVAANYKDDLGNNVSLRLVVPGDGAQTWVKAQQAQQYVGIGGFAMGGFMGFTLPQLEFAAVDELSYSTCDKSAWFARLEGGTFIHRNADTDAEHPDTVINYIGTGGNCWTAQLVDMPGAPGTASLGGYFYIHQMNAATGDYSRQLSNIVDSNGVPFTASVNIPISQ